MLYEGMLTMNTKITFPDFPRETPRMEVDQGFISMNQVFNLLYLLQNSKQQKKFEIGFYPKCSHLSENMGSTNYLIILIITCLK